MSDKPTSIPAKPKLVIVLHVDSQRLAAIVERSHAQKKKRRRKSAKPEDPETDVTKRKRTGRRRKSSAIERSESVVPIESVDTQEYIPSREVNKIDAEIRTAHRESQAFLVSKHMTRWAKMAQEPADSIDTETVLVKLSQNTCATAVTVPRIPSHVSPNVQALVAGSHYMMQEIDEAVKKQQQALAEHIIDDEPILLEGPPRLNLHGHPSPPVSHPEPLSRIQRPLISEPVQPLPHLFASAKPHDSRDPGYYLAAATRDHAVQPKPQRDRGVDIDLKMAHLRNIRQFNSQYVPSPHSSKLVKAARGVAYAYDTDSDIDIPHVFNPPRREKAMRLHDRLLCEMTEASDRMHYRRRVRFEYRQHTARVCKEVVKSDIKTRGPFVTDTENIGAFVINLPTIDAGRDKALKLGYKRKNTPSQAREQSTQRTASRQRSEGSEMWRTAEEWRRIVASKGVSLGRDVRRQLGLDRFENEAMNRDTVSQVMGLANSWDVDGETERRRNDAAVGYYQGGSELFRGYVR